MTKRTRAAIACIVVGLGLALILWRWLLRPPADTAQPVPPGTASIEPPAKNAYKDVIAAALRVGPVEGGLDSEAQRVLLQRSSAALSLLRSALDGQSVVTDDMRPSDPSQVFRPMMRLLYYSAQVAKRDRRFGDAARDCLDLVRLGNAISRGGDADDHLMRCTCLWLATQQLASLIDDLPESTCRELAGRLAAEVDRTEPIEVAYQRTLMKLQKEKGQRSFDIERNAGVFAQQLADYQRRDKICRAEVELCMTKLALRAYQMRHHRLPDSLQELAPGVLPRLPLDPWRQQGLIYRRDATGYRLYSVGPDGNDDGGRPVPRDMLKNGATGDLFL